MSSTDTKQAQQGVSFVAPSQALNGGSAFAAVIPNAPYSAQPMGSSTLKPYVAAGNKQITQQVIVAEKTRWGIELTDRTFLYSVMDLTHTAQMAMAMASTINDPELRVFIEDYVRQGLNYSTNTHAGYIETMRVRLNEHIQARVEPSWGDRLKAFFGLV